MLVLSPDVSSPRRAARGFGVVTTQTVTVLFTDLVGSTELSARLDPQRADEMRQTHFSLLRSAIQTAGGTEVKNLGDGLMVAFTSLSRALACAVAMQQSIDRHNRRTDGEPLAVRIGISAGEATEDDGDYFGDPVIEASRLCSQAVGGQILATEMVRALVGRHATQTFVPIGDLALKGLPYPVPTFEVAWEPVTTADSPGQFPLPARLVGASAESLFAFFGRVHELTRLGDSLKACASESRLRVELISGEPGMGKTTLVAQAARSAHALGANVLYGSCEEGLGVPYQPWISALGDLIDQSDEAMLQGFVESRGPWLAQLLPDLARRLSIEVPTLNTDADTERFLILEGAARLLAAASVDAPLFVVLDDLHWVDAASLQMLRHLVASSVPMSVLVVGTFRESDLSRGHALADALADLRRESCVDRIDLLGLEDHDIVDLLEAAAGHKMPEEGVALAYALGRETGGNPFFLVEVIRHLSDNGAFVQDDEGRWVLSTEFEALSLPTSVREVVGHRVARLGDETEQMLSLAAVIGRDFDVELLARLLATDEDRVLDLLEGAIRAGLVNEAGDEGGRYSFVHALIQHTLYQDLGATRRQRAHQRVAEALEASNSHSDKQAAELARHWMAATRLTDSAKALRYTRLAGDAALSAFAPADAISWYSQALELLDRRPGTNDRERCRLLIDLGTAQRQVGRPEHRQMLLDAAALAKRLDDTELLVAAALATARGHVRLGEDDPEWIDVMEGALTALGNGDDSLRARLLVALAEMTDGRLWERRRDLATEALALARRSGDVAIELDVMTKGYGFRAQPESWSGRMAETAHAIVLADQLGDVAARCVSRYNRIQACMEVCDLEEADKQLDELSFLANQAGVPGWQSWPLISRAGRLTISADFEAAEAVNDEALAIGLRGLEPRASLAGYGGTLYEIRNAQGRLDEIVDIFADAAEANPAITALRAALMDLYCGLGRLDEARVLFEPDVASEFATVPRDHVWTTAMAHYADSAVVLQDVRAARCLYEEIHPFAHLVIYPLGPILGSLARPAGRLAHLLGHAQESESLFESALSVHRVLQAPYWIARTELEFGDFLVDRGARGDLEKAREFALSALSASQTHGFGVLEQTAHARLASLP